MDGRAVSERGKRLNRVIWGLVDDQRGETYQSIKTDIPKDWRRDVDEDHPEWFTYVCGEYEIERRPYGRTQWTFHPTRQDCRVGDGFYSRLKDAKAACERNARGEERRHFA